MVKWYHASFPSSKRGFDSRYPLQTILDMTPPALTPLGPDVLRPLGIPAPWAFGMADRVRFHELDVLNHVNNATYLSWFETVRVHYVRAYGLSQYGPDDPQIVLKGVTCDYHAPLHLSDPYVITARCRSFRRTSFVKEYGVWSEGTLKVQGTAVVVLTEKNGSAKVPVPEAIKAVFAERDGAEDQS